MRVSAGLLIIWNDKILLGHPTNAKWYGTFTIPKGGVELNETNLEAAIRETKEEIGLEFNVSDIIIEDENIINYIDKKTGEIYKKIIYGIV
jgi:ADP-ribose pyrophosphatase YjhB (NUDIX family)